MKAKINKIIQRILMGGFLIFVVQGEILATVVSSSDPRTTIPTELKAVVVSGNPGALAVSPSGPPLDVLLNFPGGNAFDSSGTLDNNGGGGGSWHLLQLRDGAVSPFAINFDFCPSTGHV